MELKTFLKFAVVVGCFHMFAKAQSQVSNNVILNATKADSKDVTFVEEKQEKRWLLYAQNNTDEEQEAFLLVKGTGFRRSADRPIIKVIPPNEKVLLKTLIPLQGADPTYTKIFTFRSQLQTISKRKGENNEEYVNIRPIKPEEFTIFIEDGCDKCDILLNYLIDNNLKYRQLDLNTNHKVTEFLFDHLKKESGYKGGIIDLPAIFYQGRKHYSINDIKKFIRDYDWGGLKKG